MIINTAQLELILSEINQETIVITFVDKTYKLIFDVFCQFWQKLNLNNLLIVCLDEEAIEIAKKYSHRYLYVPYNIKSRWEFWHIRLKILNNIFKFAKKTIIHTDSDCFWINNIIPHLELCVDVDAHYSLGGAHPKHIADAYGFVLCCGFFCINYNNRTFNFFDSILMDESKDDQVATNKWVFSNATTVENLTSPTDQLHSKYIKLPNLAIKGLKHTVVTRWKECPLEIIKTHFCYHPFLTGTNEEKLEQLNHVRLLL